MFTPLASETCPVVETSTTVSNTIPSAPQTAKQTSRNRRKKRSNRSLRSPKIEIQLPPHKPKKCTFTGYIRRAHVYLSQIWLLRHKPKHYLTGGYTWHVRKVCEFGVWRGPRWNWKKSVKPKKWRQLENIVLPPPMETKNISSLAQSDTHSWADRDDHSTPSLNPVYLCPDGGQNPSISSLQEQQMYLNNPTKHQNAQQQEFSDSARFFYT
ncbi:hypothetical protein TNCV_2757981 [Trichonephila clavipes]|nr:hypothetical protein TNCV_2757981 [Trichonephila clavipes]